MNIETLDFIYKSAIGAMLALTMYGIHLARKAGK